VLTFLVLSLSVHEAAHAFAAYRCGDDTAKRQGRLTLNPIDHIDPFMTILLPLVLWMGSNGAFVFGGAKPVPYNPHNLRNPKRDDVIIAVAGPASNILLAFLFMLVLKFVIFFTSYDSGSLMVEALWYTVRLNIVLALFNMVPIPPLDGSSIVLRFLPESAKDVFYQIERFGLLVIMALLYWVPGFSQMLTEGTKQVWNLLFLLTGGSWL